MASRFTMSRCSSRRSVIQNSHHPGTSSRRTFATSVHVVLAVAPAPVQHRERTVNIYNWSDYVEPTVIEAFSKETGIAVKYDTFDANETLETKLLAGKSGYDVVAPTAYFLQRQISAGVFQKLDKSKLGNLGNVWPDIARKLAADDPSNEHAVNYMWGTTGIGYSVKKAREIVKPDGPIEAVMASWDIVLKPESLARFKGCGVDMLDSPDDIMTAALH